MLTKSPNLMVHMQCHDSTGSVTLIICGEWWESEKVKQIYDNKKYVQELDPIYSANKMFIPV